MPKAKGKTNSQVTISKFFNFKTSSSNTTSKCTTSVDGTGYVDKKAAEGNRTAVKTIEYSTKRPISSSAGTSKRQKLNSTDNDQILTPSTSSPAKPITPITLSKDTRHKLESFNHEAEATKSGSDISISDLKRAEADHITIECFQTEGEKTKTNIEDVSTCNETSESPPGNKAVFAIKNKLSKFGTAQKTGVKVKPKHTPLEQQFLELKEKHPDAVLFVECGYKYRFFGSDAETAAKELNIFAHPDHSFMTASIPVHRLHVHVRRLVAKGYKVGVVKQMETAALKAAGDNRNTPFTRRLSALYTKTTLIGQDVDPVCLPDGDALPGQTSRTYLMCIYEPDVTSRNKAHEIAIVSVQPSTGELIYDVFTDLPTRSELEMRVAHIGPSELLLPHSMTPATEKVIRQLTAFSCRTDDRLRVERLADEEFEPKNADKGVSDFYGESPSLSSMLKLPKPVLSCMNALITYLKDFNLHNILKMSSNLQRFSNAEDRMLLPATTVRNLEVFRNLTDGKTHGSLFWALNHTTTRFGSRLLRDWVSKPLLDVSVIEVRLDAVTELLTVDRPALTGLREVLTRLPDLEKGLGTILHKRCSTQEFLSVCNALVTVREAVLPYQAALGAQLDSTLLRDLTSDLPDLLDGITDWVQALDEEAAKIGDKTNLFTDPSCYPDVLKCKSDIEAVLSGLEDHRKEIAKVLGLISFSYKTIMGTEFLIDVKNKDIKHVPTDWIKVNGTKMTCRFHSPYILSQFRKLSQLREKLVLVCNDGWNQFLVSFEEVYPCYKKAIEHLATLDCLLSLTTVAKQDGFCRPSFSSGSGSEVHIESGRHPVVDLLLGEREQYVPNDTHLEAAGQRCAVVTGPNMGGKSSYIKQVALLTIMAQVGTYVPAESATVGIVDAVFTRMGACDELFTGRSTFMVELQEASEVMAHASPRSLVILDELGRGTSTHDGVAIAYATLKYFIEDVKCMTLFVTHYPPLAEIECLYPDHVKNYHMSFLINDTDQWEENAVMEPSEGASSSEWITFLYHLMVGMAGRSYGLNVARLAGIPNDIIETAAVKAQMLENMVSKTSSERVQFMRLWTSDPKDVSSVIRDGAANPSWDAHSPHYKQSNMDSMYPVYIA